MPKVEDSAVPALLPMKQSRWAPGLYAIDALQQNNANAYQKWHALEASGVYSGRETHRMKDVNEHSGIAQARIIGARKRADSVDQTNRALGPAVHLHGQLRYTRDV